MSTVGDVQSVARSNELMISVSMRDFDDPFDVGVRWLVQVSAVVHHRWSMELIGNCRGADTQRSRLHHTLG